MVAASELEVADVFRAYGGAYQARYGRSMPLRHWRVIEAIEQCRTAALGGHVYVCDRCGHEKVAYNSCRNRHCPKCQALAKERWLQARRAELLPIEYFHVVFTIPGALNPIVLRNQRVMYNILFHAASETLQTIAADPKHLGARIGFMAILHSWGQNLMDHPHLHCVVPGGGLSSDGERWLPCRRGFFLPVRVLSRLFRGKFLDGLRKARKSGDVIFPGEIRKFEDPSHFKKLMDDLYATEWVVYSKRPFGGPQQVLDYLGRYTHRIAISNHRLIRMEDDRVVFRWKDYARGNRLGSMKLHAVEFIRRYLLHVLPHGFMRIRYYGLLANCHRSENLARCRQLLGVHVEPPDTPERESWQEILERLTGIDPTLCPVCGEGRLRCREVIPPASGNEPHSARGPP